MVWLFRNITNQIIGFGSVGPINWRWPLPNGNYTRLLYIPMLGIDQRYQGQPPDREWRYSHQIMQHLKFAAHQMNADLKTPSEWLLLLVAPDNAGAIHLYEQFDFQLLPDVTRGPGLRVMKHHLAE